MAEAEIRIAPGDSNDVTMSSNEAIEVDEIGAAEVADEDVEANGEEGGEQAVATTAEDEKLANLHLTFADYLQSPIRHLEIGPPSDPKTLTAHEALLTRSPYFATALRASPTISLPDVSLPAISSVLEYLYTGEYFPAKLAHTLTPDPSLPSTDTTGAQLLHHAQVYTLAEKLSLPELKSLSHSKIHLIRSTAAAELVYARYVYTHTDRADVTIRKPVASFWGQRSHVLRHETEGGFREMCLEFPEFAFDVLSFVLDVEEKREKRQSSSGGGGGHRHSHHRGGSGSTEGTPVTGGLGTPGRVPRKRARAER